MNKHSELIIDSFAGGGGASLGIAWATGRSPDIAINHCEEALAMHQANHPSTKHVREDVWQADLRKLVGRRRVGLLWLSPDCRHFSRAKGGKPVAKSVRSLAWIACKWAEQVRPRVILLENVREFAEWGPVVPQWKCECGWKGTEGQATLVRSRRRCPRCESARLVDTGALVPCPDRKGLTFRRWLGRLRNLGYSVQYKSLDAADFGAPTRRKRLFVVARRDGRPIQWPEPTHADPRKISDTPLFSRLKPWRTAAECIDWSIPCPSIFDRKKPLAEKTLRRIAEGIRRYVLEAAEPFIVPMTHSGERRSHPTSEPLPTITSAHRGEFAVCAPVVASLAHGEGKDGRWGRGANSVDSPVGTVHAGGKNFALVSAFLAKHNFDQTAQSVDHPAPTLVSRGTQNQLVAANLVRMNYGDKQWNDVREPLVTVTTANHVGLVCSFLVRYFGTAIGQHVLEPLSTVTAKDRFGLLVVRIHGEPYVIVDIGLRMLAPRELARAQGFPDTYILTGTKTSQVARLGNSVCPQVAAALARANVGNDAGIYQAQAAGGER